MDSGPADAEPTDAEPTAPVPLNRAERRARGKGGAKSQPAGPGKIPGRTNASQGPRMWANRRGGG